jgi:hypothetical protein
LLETQAYVATADDQAKQILARSVVRPFHQSHRVKRDPALDVKQDKVTAKRTEEAIPGTLVAVSDDSGENVIVIEEYGHVKSEEKVANLLTKPLGRNAFERLTSKYLFRRSQTVLEGAQLKDTLKPP